jgi:UDP-N-acetylmuramoyl-L-alanyl-D-glutamate--2,6-diaminopimelate ligase
MRNLKDILHQIDFQLISGSLDQEINALQFDSRIVQKNNLFFAIVGVANDGHLFIDKVIAAGCKTIMVQRKLDLPLEITQILVKDTNEALALAACNFYDHPADQLKLIGQQAGESHN